MSKKPIIVFEGIEGSGKSHHINKVSKYLDKKKGKDLDWDDVKASAKIFTKKK